jgi:hypothetical protein
MKKIILLPAVFLFFVSVAQETIPPSFATTIEYQPVNFEPLKKFKSLDQSIEAGGISNNISLTRPATAYFNSQTMKQYLSEDWTSFRISQKQKEWSRYNNGKLNDLYKKEWLDNKYNVQQRWMIQKVKGN